jgi:hypothetical protein
VPVLIADTTPAAETIAAAELEDAQGLTLAGVPEPVSCKVFPPTVMFCMPVIVGNTFTVADTALLIVEAPVDVNEMLPLGEPDANALTRKNKDVVATVVPDLVRVTVLPNPDEEFVDISNPVGDVIIMFEVRLLPDTVNVWFVDAVP